MRRLMWLLALAACSADERPSAPVAQVAARAGAGASSQSSGSAGDAHDAGSGGATVAAAGSGGVAGRSPSAGTSSIRPDASVAGAAGAAGAAGSAIPAAGSGGTPALAPAAMSGKATPSAGCMKMTARPQGGMIMQSDRIYTFPAAYDGKTPMPLMLGLHAAGNPVTQIQSLTQGSKLETDLVRVLPKSAGSAWVYNTDIAKVNSVLDDVLSTYCIDTGRMFATGHSSGAQMVVQMLCKGEKRFKAVAPVAASKYCNSFSPVPALYIQGMMDAQRGGGNGMDVVTMFTTSNGCSMQTVPKTEVHGCTSNFDRMQVTPGCVTYQDCKAQTIWCSHNDNGYNNSDGRQHGWPCFASAAIADFFLGQP